MNTRFDPKVRMIPVSQINILKPPGTWQKEVCPDRCQHCQSGPSRSRTRFANAAAEMATPVTISCAGRGVLEAYAELGQPRSPALVVEGSKEDLMLMSLAENLPGASTPRVELVREISLLKDRGYTHTEIARKTDLDVTYVKGILSYWRKARERLLQAVETVSLPVYIAITIATSDDKSVQRALQEAYERKTCEENRLVRAAD